MKLRSYYLFWRCPRSDLVKKGRFDKAKKLLEGVTAAASPQSFTGRKGFAVIAVNPQNKTGVLFVINA